MLWNGLRSAGYTQNFAHDRVYRVFKDKTIFIAAKGRNSISQGLRLIGAHADTPRIDLKQHPLYEACGVGTGKNPLLRRHPQIPVAFAPAGPCTAWW